MNNEKIIKRKFESQKGAAWMLYDVDDLLYGMLQYIATYDTNNNKLYLTKKTYAVSKEEIMNITGIKTPKTLTRHMDKLIEKELIKPFTLKVNEHEYACYEITQNTDIFGKYIEKDWLYYLLATRSQQALKVYIFLLDKYDWFVKDKPGECYTFTNKVVMDALGYSKESSSASKTVTAILDSLSREGIISFASYYETLYHNETGQPYTVHQIKLLHVAHSEDELRK